MRELAANTLPTLADAPKMVVPTKSALSSWQMFSRQGAASPNFQGRLVARYNQLITFSYLSFQAASIQSMGGVCVDRAGGREALQALPQPGRRGELPRPRALRAGPLGAYVAPLVSTEPCSLMRIGPLSPWGGLVGLCSLEIPVPEPTLSPPLSGAAAMRDLYSAAAVTGSHRERRVRYVAFPVCNEMAPLISMSCRKQSYT